MLIISVYCSRYWNIIFTDNQIIIYIDTQNITKKMILKKAAISAAQSTNEKINCDFYILKYL